MSVEKRKRKKHGQASDGDRGGDVRDDGLRWGTETRNTQTAGREQLGAFAPLFAELNDDVLFSECGTRAGSTRRPGASSPSWCS